MAAERILTTEEVQAVEYLRNLGTLKLSHEGLRAERDRLLAERERFIEALKAYERLDDYHANCDDCDGVPAPEACDKCFPFADDARLKMRAALADAQQERT